MGCVFPTVASPPRIPDYELLRLIGSGSYGDVWLARGITGVFRAVKIVWRDRFTDPRPYEREFSGITRFAAISVREPSQLALLHAGRDSVAGYFYYVMELADDAATGRTIDPEHYVPLTLRELRERRERLPPAEVITLGVALARALATLHAEGLVHRDIKPSNVVFVGGVPKLADVGLVTAASEGVTFVGTEGYVPREGPGAPAADVYGLGKVLYELATGLDRNDWPRLPSHLAELPLWRELLELNEVLVRACEADATRRFADAVALRDELLLLQAGKSVRRLRATERHLSRALRSVAVLAVAAALAGTGAWIAQNRADREMALRAEAETERDQLRHRATYSANLARAQRAIEHDELARARQLLAEAAPRPGAPDLRGLEWRALWHLAQGDPRREIRPAGPPVAALALSPDESVLAIHDLQQNAALHTTRDGTQRVRVEGMRKCAGFSADGRWLVGLDASHRARRWSAATGAADDAVGPVFETVVATMGENAVVGIDSTDTLQARVWDFAQQKETLVLDLAASDSGGKWITYRCAASADGRAIVHAAVQGSGSAAQFRLACIRFGPRAAVSTRAMGRAVPAAVGVDRISPWALFESRTPDAPGEFWRCSGESWQRTDESLPRDTRGYVSFAADGTEGVVVARSRQLAWLHPRQSGVIINTARGHSGGITDVVASPRLGAIFSASGDGAVYQWPLAGPTPRHHPTWDSLGGTTNIVFTPDSRSVWIPRDGITCVRLDLGTMTPIARAADMVYPVAIDGDVLTGVGATSGLVRVHAGTGDPVDRIMVSEFRARIAAVAPDGRAIAVIDHAGNLLAPGTAGPRIVRRELQRHYLMGFDHTGARLWTVSGLSREIICWSWPDGRTLWQARLPALASAFRLQPKEPHLLIALETGVLQLRHAETGELVREVESGSSAPQTLALARNPPRVLAGGREGEVQFLDGVSWEPLHSIPLGSAEILHRMVLSPDEKTLAVLTRSGTLRVLRTE